MKAKDAYQRKLQEFLDEIRDKCDFTFVADKVPQRVLDALNEPFDEDEYADYTPQGREAAKEDHWRQCQERALYEFQRCCYGDWVDGLVEDISISFEDETCSVYVSIPRLGYSCLLQLEEKDW